MKLLPIIFSFLCIFSYAVLAEDEVSAEIIELSSEAEAGGSAEFLVNITNHQIEKDIYRLSYDTRSIAPFSDFASSILIEPSQIKLDSGESGFFHVTIKIIDTANEDRNYETVLSLSSLTKPKIDEKVTLRTYVVSPEDIILIFPEIPEEIVPGMEASIKIRLKNRSNIKLSNYEILITSDLPQFYKNFVTDFMPNEEIIETLIVKTDQSLSPGNYIVNIKVYDSNSKTRGSYSSAFTITKNENIHEQKEEDAGFMSKKIKITKKNEGNIKSSLAIESKIGFFARLFTKSNPEPEVNDENYIWRKELLPGDEFTVEYTTNYRPILYGILIIIIAALSMNYLIDSSVLVKKRIYQIKHNQDGLSELKILIHVKNGRREEITNVGIIDVLPNTMGSPEDFGTLKPNTIQQGTKGKRFIWEIDRLASHEERIISYKVKSKLKLIGETKLPPCTVQYKTKKGKIISERSAALFLEHTPKHE